MKNNFKLAYSIFFFLLATFQINAAEKVDFLKTDWTFKGLFGKFDRGSLQRGYQVYTEVCASCHSMKYVSYRNLFEPGGPEFTKDQAKAIAASFEVTDGPNNDGEMFTRPAKLSDKFVMPYENVKAAQAANGGAYPPDMSVLAKARSGGVDYIYSLLLGYEDAPSNIDVGEGYYNKYMAGNIIAMPQPLYGDDVIYKDGTTPTLEQEVLDITTFLTWAAMPDLEKRRSAGIKVLIFLLVMTFFFFFSYRKIWKDLK